MTEKEGVNKCRNVSPLSKLSQYLVTLIVDFLLKIVFMQNICQKKKCCTRHVSFSQGGGGGGSVLIYL